MSSALHPSWSDAGLWLFGRRPGPIVDKIAFLLGVDESTYLDDVVGRVSRPPGGMIETTMAGEFEPALRRLGRGEALLVPTRGDHLAVFGAGHFAYEGFACIHIEMRPAPPVAFFERLPVGAQAPFDSFGSGHVFASLARLEELSLVDGMYAVEGQGLVGDDPRWRFIEAGGHLERPINQVSEEPIGRFTPAQLLERCAAHGIYPNRPDWYGTPTLVRRVPVPFFLEENDWELNAGPYQLALYEGGRVVAEDDRLAPLALLIDSLAEDREALRQIMLGRVPEHLHGLRPLTGDVGAAMVFRRAHGRPVTVETAPTHVLAGPSGMDLPLALGELIPAALRLRVRRAERGR